MLDSNALSYVRKFFHATGDLHITEFTLLLSIALQTPKNMPLVIIVQRILATFEVMDIDCTGTVSWAQFSSFLIQSPSSTGSVDSPVLFDQPDVHPTSHLLNCDQAYLQGDRLILYGSDPAPLLTHPRTLTARPMPARHTSRILAIQQIGPPFDWTLTFAADNTVKICESSVLVVLGTGTTVTTVSSVAYADTLGSTRHQLYVGLIDGSVAVYALNPLTPRLPAPRVFRPHTDIVSAVLPIPEVALVFTCSFDKTIVATDPVHLQTYVRQPAAHDRAVTTIVHSDFQHVVVSAGLDRAVHVWNVLSLLRVGSLAIDFTPHSIMSIPATPVICGVEQGCGVRLWDIQSGQTLQAHPPHTGLTATWAALLHPRLLLVGAGGATIVHGYTDNTGADAATRGIVSAMTFAPDGRRLYVGHGEAVSVWTHGALQSEFVVGQVVTALALTLNGRFLVIATERTVSLRCIPLDYTRPWLPIAGVQTLHYVEAGPAVWIVTSAAAHLYPIWKRAPIVTVPLK